MSRRNVVLIRRDRLPRGPAANDAASPADTHRAAELKAMARGDVLEVFRRLEAPDLAEMDGEYVATLLDHGNTAMNVIAFLATNVPYRWLGKAFHPVDGATGQGYNWFQGRVRTVRRYRMRTSVKASAIDDRRSYFLEYAAFNRGLMRAMVDEVRRVEPGLYLGLGRIGGPRSRGGLYPFLLEGPVGPFADPKAT